jgi:hypothetical protein
VDPLSRPFAQVFAERHGDRTVEPHRGAGLPLGGTDLVDACGLDSNLVAELVAHLSIDDDAEVPGSRPVRDDGEHACIAPPQALGRSPREEQGAGSVSRPEALAADPGRRADDHRIGKHRAEVTITVSRS